MTRTRVAAAGLGLLGLGLALPLLVAGCAVGYATAPVPAVSLGYASGGGRPHPGYYCADCHGVSYFDPYYDLCLRYGYRLDWQRSPEVTAAYRRDYVAIKRADPTVGRYRYPRGAKKEARERFADEQGRMPRYEGASPSTPSKRSSGPPRGPKVNGSKDQDSKGESSGPPREKREPPRGKTGRDEGKTEPGRSAS